MCFRLSSEIPVCVRYTLYFIRSLFSNSSLRFLTSWRLESISLFFDLRLICSRGCKPTAARHRFWLNGFRIVNKLRCLVKINGLATYGALSKMASSRCWVFFRRDCWKIFELSLSSVHWILSRGREYVIIRLCECDVLMVRFNGSLYCSWWIGTDHFIISFLVEWWVFCLLGVVSV